MALLKGPRSRLLSKAKRGFRGYPAATVIFYGPNASFASKIAIGIVRGENKEPEMHRFFSETIDLRENEEIGEQILALLKQQGVLSVIMADRILGCPHEEGIDYPDGTSCPQCPYWAGRDRYSHVRIQ
jgi:hypothetical protein